MPFVEHVVLGGDARTYLDADLQAATQYEYRVRACRRQRCSAESGTARASTENPDRALHDRADDITGPQIRVMYVVPSDGGDRALDTRTTLKQSVASFHAWFTGKSGGYTLRFDRHQGELDIGFFRLTLSDADVASSPRWPIEYLLAEAGLLAEDKLYLVYYDGTGGAFCGGASWPPVVPGQLAAMYLRSVNCNVPFTTTVASPGYWEFAALHDLVHMLGIVSPSAPNHTATYPAHVPDQSDLMYTGPAPWLTGGGLTIDVGGDDYFGNAVRSDLPSLDKSPYIAAPMPGAAANAAASLREMTAAEARALGDALTRLPMHQSFPFPHR